MAEFFGFAPEDDMALRNCELVAFAATARLQEARHFYGEILGLELIQETPAADVFDAHGTMLRISKVAALTAASYTVLGWKVGDLRKIAAQLRGRGVRFERYPQM